MPKQSAALYLSDIKNCIKNIEEFTRGYTFVDFFDDQKTIDAVVRNLEIIGEATKNIPDEFKKKHHEIPWKQIMGMRNKVIHEYAGVDTEIIWQTIKQDIPDLKQKMRRIEI